MPICWPTSDSKTQQVGQDEEDEEPSHESRQLVQQLQAAFPEAAVQLQPVQQGVPKTAPADSLFARCARCCLVMIVSASEPDICTGHSHTHHSAWSHAGMHIPSSSGLPL